MKFIRFLLDSAPGLFYRLVSLVLFESGLRIMLLAIVGLWLGNVIMEKQLPGMIYLFWFMATFIAYVIIRHQFGLVSGKLLSQATMTLRGDILNTLALVNYSDKERFPSSRVYSVLIGDGRMLEQSGYSHVNIFSKLFRMGWVFLYVALLSPLIFLLCIVSLVCVGIIYGLFQRYMDIRERQAAKAEAAFFHSAEQLVLGGKETRLQFFSFLPRIMGSLTQTARTLCMSRMEQGVGMAAIYLSSDVLLQMLVFGLVVALPMAEWVDLSVIIAVVPVLLNLPVRVLKECAPVIRRNDVALDNLKNLRQQLSVLAKKPSLLSWYPVMECLEFKDVTYQYESADSVNQFVVGPLSFSLSCRTITFVVGHNGSGKSTLMKLMSGLYCPQSGYICINGEAVDLTIYKDYFGVIFSDFHLFDRLYGLPSVSSETINYWLHRFRLDHKVRWVAGRFSTLNLSTGQRKRLAMLVVILENRPVMIFDEWAADQDPEFREYYYHELLPELKNRGKMIIAVTHDDRYFHLADQVLMFSEGQLQKVAPLKEEGG